MFVYAGVVKSYQGVGAGFPGDVGTGASIRARINSAVHAEYLYIIKWMALPNSVGGERRYTRTRYNITDDGRNYNNK